MSLTVSQMDPVSRPVNAIKVCILTSVHLAFDGRVFHKEAKSLAKAGYDVTLVAQHDKYETVDGIKIVALSRPKNRFERITRIVWHVLKIALKEKADVYHFHDPELVSVGLVLKLFTQSKLIYDVHECYRLQILNKAWIRSYKIRRIIAFFFYQFEQFSARFFDVIICATRDIAEDFPKEKTTTIRNFTVLGMIKESQPGCIVKKEKNTIIYAGELTKIRGIRELIQAMELLEQRCELWLIGKWYEERFKEECMKLEGWHHTKYFGVVSLTEVPKYMKNADIGISTLYPVKNYLTSLPTKAFEYMSCSLPMIMSDFPYWKEVFGKCALFVDPYAAKNLAEKIQYFLENPDIASQFGKRGRQLVVEKYNWENESRKLMNLYAGLFK